MKTTLIKLSKTGKMPCASFSLAAGETCPTGSKLMAVEGSTCSKCYAAKGNYRFPIVKAARASNLMATQQANFVAEMVAILDSHRYFRWLDSGDVYSYQFLLNIIDIAEKTPWCRHWLPTQERSFLKQLVADGVVIPDNLTIRLSSVMIDSVDPLSPSLARLGIVQSAVGAVGTCPAPLQDGQCQDCRKCWNRSEKLIVYKKH